MGFFLAKKDEICESEDTKAFLREEEFVEKINFKFGVPLVVLDFLDFITGSNFIRKVQKFTNPQTYIKRFDEHNSEFNDLKGTIDDDYLPYIFQLFNSLGAI